MGSGKTGLASTDIWSLEYNQAGLAEIENFAGAVSYNSPFLVGELGNSQAFVALPVGDNVFGLSLQSRGFALYREGYYGLAYGRKLSDDFNIGIQLNYYSLQLGEGYGKVNAVTVEGGLSYNLNDNFTLAAHVANPNQSKLNDDAYLPAILRGGFQYRFSDAVRFNAEVWKSVDDDAQVHTGIVYQATKVVELDLGVSTNPATLYAGFGLNYDNLQVNISTSYHSILGYTPQLSLVYRAKG
jgi:hypothetical protein